MQGGTAGAHERALIDENGPQDAAFFFVATHVVKESTMGILWLRPTAIQRYEACPAQSKLVDRDRLRTNTTSAALVFGGCVHRACLGALLMDLQGVDAGDLGDRFLAEWEAVLTQTSVRFNQTHDEASLRDIGTRLCRGFREAWAKTGLTPVIGAHGQVLVEERLRVKLSPDVGLSGEPDLVGMDANGDVWVVDLKTPATKAFDGFAGIADQLTGYQLLVEAHRERLGLPKIRGLAFLEGLKQKSARWEWQAAERHSDQQVREYTAKALRIAALMREGYYPKRSAAAFDSPCSQCDLRGWCRTGNPEGIQFPKGNLEHLDPAKAA